MVIKQYTVCLNESWNDLLNEEGMESFDLFTKRYLSYCEHSGKKIEDYVIGIKREKMS